MKNDIAISLKGVICMKYNVCGETLTVMPEGKIDTSVAAAFETELFALIEEHKPGSAVIDAENLEYISSMGLRVMLKLKKKLPDTQVVNASAEVYDIFKMTGFTDILNVKKAMRQITLDGCEVIGKGSFGTTYKLNSDTIVKVFNDGVPFNALIQEKENAKAAFVCGVPTAIPFDTVRVGNLYGNIYELINARSLSKAICDEPERIDEYAAKTADLMKLLANTHAVTGKFRKFSDISLELLEQADSYLPGERLFTQEEKQLLTRLYNAVPERDTIVHGDFHTRNIFEQDGELLLIDMADTGIGHPLFELGNMYMALVLTAKLPDKLFRQLIGLEKKASSVFF